MNFSIEKERIIHLKVNYLLPSLTPAQIKYNATSDITFRGTQRGLLRDAVFFFFFLRFFFTHENETSKHVVEEKDNKEAVPRSSRCQGFSVAPGLYDPKIQNMFIDNFIDIM